MIDNLYDTAIYDVRFSFANGQQIPAHKKLLSTLSSVFRTMFDANWNADDPIIPIEDVTYNRFNEFVSYFYTNQLKLYANNAKDLMYLAKKYDVEDVATRCAEFMAANISPNLVVDWLDCAIKFDLADLILKCGTFISEHTLLVLASSTFVQCEMNVFATILNLKAIQCTESEMFDACIQWATAKCIKNNVDAKNYTNIRQELGSSFDSIRFSEMAGTEFAKRHDIITKLLSIPEQCQFQWAILKNPSNANRRQVKGGVSIRPYVFSFAPLGMKVTNKWDSVIKFSMSKTMLLTGFKMPIIYVETTSGEYVTFPFPCQADFTLKCLNSETQVSETVSTHYIQLHSNLEVFHLPVKELIMRNVIYELKVAYRVGQVKGRKQMSAFSVVDRVCRSIRLSTKNNAEPNFIGGLRFEEVGAGNLQHYIKTA